MRMVTRFPSLGASLVLIAISGTVSLQAQTPAFHKAPPATQQTPNPYAGKADAAAAGRTVYEQNCMMCHGATAQGTGNIPALREGPTQSAPDGSLFWYITHGDLSNGMPSWWNGCGESIPIRPR